MRIVAIHQPQYIPWLGYFHKIECCDIFCLLDTVQYKKNEYQNRNRIKTSEGWQWLTVPVTYRFPERIEEVEISPGAPWTRKHLEALRTCYRKAPYFEYVMDRFITFLNHDWRRLVDANAACLQALLECLGLQRPVVLASSLPVQTAHPTLRLIEIVRHLGGDAYLSGKDGARYMDTSLFAEQGIELFFQDFRHPLYPQLYGDFLPCMSILDLLFNCGPESLSIIRKASAGPRRD